MHAFSLTCLFSSRTELAFKLNLCVGSSSFHGLLTSFYVKTIPFVNMIINRYSFQLDKKLTCIPSSIAFRARTTGYMSVSLNNRQ